MKFKSLMAAALLTCLSGLALAQDTLQIAGGGGAKQGSTYSAEIADLIPICSTDAVTLAETNTHGGVENLQLLQANKVPLAIIPSDLLYQAKQDNAPGIALIQTVFALHPEPVHLIARSDTKTEGGFSLGNFNVGGKDVSFNNPEDLKGRRVGSAGGSAVSARLISEKLHLGWVVDAHYATTTDLLNALNKHEVDAIVFVGSAKAASAIKGNFKLIPLRGNSDTQEVYSATKVQYANLNDNRPVDTLAETALLATRTWHSAKQLKMVADLRSCLKANLDDIKDKSGTDPAWQNVTGEKFDKWQWYDLPNATATVAATMPVTPAPKKPAKK